MGVSGEERGLYGWMDWMDGLGLGMGLGVSHDVYVRLWYK